MSISEYMPAEHPGDIEELHRLAVEAIQGGDTHAALIAVAGLARTARLYASDAEEYARQATTHPLTGLPNRRALDHADALHPLAVAHYDSVGEADIVQEEAVFEERANEPKPPEGWVCLMVDLDNFKLVNDVLGHATGDELLKVTGDALTAIRRTYDQIFHFGGDEFAMIMPIYKWHDDDEKTPHNLADKKHKQFMTYVQRLIEENYSGEFGEALRVLGASFAMSLVRAGDGQPLSRHYLIEQADKVMAEAKKNKNNR